MGDTRGDVFVTTFGVPTYLFWESGNASLQVRGCSAISGSFELRLFRYKRRRTGAKQGRKRHHGWRDCTEEFVEGTRFELVGSGDIRTVKRTFVDKNGNTIVQTPSQYQLARGSGFSLNYKCAFAIFQDGKRVSDMMHFTVNYAGVYGSW